MRTVPQRFLTLHDAIERCVRTTFDSQEWHDALASIQAIIGQDTGDFAAAFFSGREIEWKHSDLTDRRTMLSEYVARELLP